jgi:hypothetical protein
VIIDYLASDPEPSNFGEGFKIGMASPGHLKPDFSGHTDRILYSNIELGFIFF